VTFIADREKIVEHMVSVLKRGDLMITLGAGDVWKLGEQVVERLKHGN
jgi:UDP-N-acetylmuramate--alanine ligase